METILAEIDEAIHSLKIQRDRSSSLEDEISILSQIVGLRKAKTIVLNQQLKHIEEYKEYLGADHG